MSLEETLDSISEPFRLKAEQRKVICALAKGKNVFALLPNQMEKMENELIYCPISFRKTSCAIVYVLNSM